MRNRLMEHDFNWHRANRLAKYVYLTAVAEGDVCTYSQSVSRFGLTVRRYKGSYAYDVGSIPLRLCLLFKIVIHGQS